MSAAAWFIAGLIAGGAAVRLLFPRSINATVNLNIDAHGTPDDVIRRLPTVIAENNESLRESIRKVMR